MPKTATARLPDGEVEAHGCGGRLPIRRRGRCLRRRTSSFTLSQEVGVATRDPNTEPRACLGLGRVGGVEGGGETWGVSFLLVYSVHGFPKVLMQSTSQFVQSVKIKENDTAPFRLLQMETLYSERQGRLCLAKARGAKDLPAARRKSHLPASAARSCLSPLDLERLRVQNGGTQGRPGRDEHELSEGRPIVGSYLLSILCP